MSTWTVRDIHEAPGMAYPFTIRGLGYLFRTKDEARDCVKRLGAWEAGKGPCPTIEEYR